MKTSLPDTLRNPGPEYRGAPFWAWNARITPEGVREQVPIFRDMGYGGFFMHSRPGLDTPYLSDEWFDCIRAGIEAAREAGIKAWLYDEDRWPSGTGGGMVAKQDPSHAATELRCAVIPVGAEPPPLPSDVRGVWWFAAAPQADSPALSEAVVLSQRPDSQVQPRVSSYRRIVGPSAPLRRSESLLLRVHGEPTVSSSWYNGGRYLDTLSRKAVRHFIRLVYDAYAREVGEEFGKTVPGIFFDEPSLFPEGWTARLPAWFWRRFGYDPVDHLPEIFLDVRGAAFSRFRHDYARCRTELFADAFAGEIGRWCACHGFLCTGHMLAEDKLLDQALAIGAAMPHYGPMQLPGIDMLTQNWLAFNTAKQCVSVARQHGRRRRMTELFAACGWDFPFEGFKATAEWQLALGVNFRVPHLVWYSMEGIAKRDYPGSLLRQEPWGDHWAHLEDRLARLTAALTQGTDVADLLVVHPIESDWGLRLRSPGPEVASLEADFAALTAELLAAKTDFDFGDEGDLAKAKVHPDSQDHPDSQVPSSHPDSQAPSCVVLGRASYRAIALQPLLTIRSTTLHLLEAFAKAGGTVLCWGDPPAFVDGKPSRAPARVYARFHRFAGPAAVAAAAAALVGRVRVEQDGDTVRPALCLVNETPSLTALFVCNVGCEFPDAQHVMNAPGVRERTLEFQRATIALRAPAGRHVYELDADTGDLHAVSATYADGEYRFASPLVRLGSRLFLVSATPLPAVAPVSSKASPVSVVRATSRAVPVSLSEPNVLVLDHPTRFAFDDVEQPSCFILDADDALRAHLGAGPRSHRQEQPWVRRVADSAHPATRADSLESQASSRLPSARVHLEYRFRATAAVSVPCHLALERASDFVVHLNGRRLRAGKGWWVDPSLPLVRIPAGAIIKGENVLTLDMANYDVLHPGLEACYLLGDFGVASDGAALLPAPRTLRLGDWCPQGLPNYAGNVTYRIPVPKAVKAAAARGGRVIVRTSEFAGTAVEFAVSGTPGVFRGWAPYEADLTDALASASDAELLVTVYGHRRNAFGPLYFDGTDPMWIGPNELRAHKTNRRTLVPVGLLSPVEFMIDKAHTVTNGRTLP